MQNSIGMFAVKPCSLCAITNLASGSGFASPTIFAKGMPSQCWSRRDHVVTQCMSAVTEVLSSS